MRPSILGAALVGLAMSGCIESDEVQDNATESLPVKSAKQTPADTISIRPEITKILAIVEDEDGDVMPLRTKDGVDDIPPPKPPNPPHPQGQKPLAQCHEDDHAYAVDRDRDWVRDSLAAADVTCSAVSLDEDIVRARFQQVKEIIGGRDAYNFGSYTLTANDPSGLLDILVAKGIVTDRKNAILALRYVGLTLKDRQGKAAGFFLENVNNSKAWAKGFMPVYSFEVKNGVLTLRVVREGKDAFDHEYTASLFPWEGNADESLADLTDIPRPACPKTDWDWQRPDDDPFDPKNDLDFKYQSGRKSPHKYLARLARLLPSNWNVAAIPDRESGLAIEMMFDHCCDGSPERWFEDHRKHMGIGKKEIMVSGTRGGFVVMGPSGIYAFEPGKDGHLRWGAKTKWMRSGADAVDAELSRYDDEPKNDFNPRLARTTGTLVRRGNPDGSERYWEDELRGTANSGNWCRNTAPAGLAAMRYLVGKAPFWIYDKYYGGFSSFEGSEQFELLDTKKDGDGDNDIYKVRFKQ